MNWRLGLFMNSDRVSGQTSTQHKRNILDAPKPTHSRNQWRRVHKVSRNTCPNSSVLNVKNDTITDHTYLTPFLDAEAYPMTDIFPNSPHRCGQTYRKGPHHHVTEIFFFLSNRLLTPFQNAKSSGVFVWMKMIFFESNSASCLG